MMSKIVGDFSGQRQLGLSIRGSNPLNIGLLVLFSTDTIFHPVIFPPTYFPSHSQTHKTTSRPLSPICAQRVIADNNNHHGHVGALSQSLGVRDVY